MNDFEKLIDILEQSVAKHGEKPLTNKWLLNILKLVESRQKEVDFYNDLEGER